MLPRVRRAALLSVFLLAWVAVPAHAAFPGQNGRISFQYFDDDLAFATMNANGSDQQRFALPPAVPPTIAGFNLLSTPRWSPDGTKIVFATGQSPNCGTDGSGAIGIHVVNPDGTGFRNVTSPQCVSGLGQRDFDPSWSPDGTRIVFSSNRNRDCGFGLCSQRAIFTISAAGGGIRQLTHPATAATASENDGQPVFSPSGRIAFVRSAFAGAAGDLWVMNADGSGQTRLTSGAADDQWPSWSPDSTQLAFSSDSGSPANSSCSSFTRCNSEIFKLNVATPTVRTKLTNAPGLADDHPAWSPNGGQIVWDRSQPTDASRPPPDIYTMNADGTSQTNVTLGEYTGKGYMHPDWQPRALAPVPTQPNVHARMDKQTVLDREANSGSVAISQRAPSGGTVVSLSSNDPVAKFDPATVLSVAPDGQHATVRIAAGAQSATFGTLGAHATARSAPVITATIPGRSTTTTYFQLAGPTGLGRVTVFPTDTVQGGSSTLVQAALNDVLGPGAAPITVTFTLTGGSGVAVFRSEPGVTVAPGGRTATATITTLSTDVHVDTTPVPLGSNIPVTVTATAVVNGASSSQQGSFSIVPGPKVTGLSLSPASIQGGTGQSRATVTISEPAPLGLTLAVSESDPSGVIHPQVTEIAVPFGETTTSFFVDATPPAPAASTTADVTVSFNGSSKTATITVTPGPPPPPPAALASVTLNPASVTGGNASQGTLTLDRAAPAGGVSFTVTSDKPGVATTSPATVTVPAGATTRTFAVTTTAVTASTPAVFTATNATAGTGTATLTVNPRPVTPPDTLRVTRAQYDTAKRELRVEATSTNATATLTAFVDATGARIGQLTNNGGTYRGQFTNVDNPGVVRVTSSAGGSATLAVSGASGTVHATPTTATTPSAGALAAPKRLDIALLHATSEIALPRPDPHDATAPAVDRLRLLPARFRVGSARGMLVSLTLSEAARVTLSFARLRGSRVAAMAERVTKTLPAGRVRIRFNGVLPSGRRLLPGRYRVLVDAVDAAGHRSRSVRAVFVARL